MFPQKDQLVCYNLVYQCVHSWAHPWTSNCPTIHNETQPCLLRALTLHKRTMGMRPLACVIMTMSAAGLAMWLGGRGWMGGVGQWQIEANQIYPIFDNC